MADPDIIADLLLAHADDMNSILPVAMPDVAFSVPQDGKFLRVDLFTNSPFWEGLRSGRVDQGILQVAVHWPKGEGIIKPLQVVADVMAHWSKNTILFAPTAKVKINREPWAASSLPDDLGTVTPITISWTAT